MARVRRERNSSSGFPHRAFVRVSRDAWARFHDEWAAIDRLWAPCGDPEHIEAIASLRMTARDELREKARLGALLEGVSPEDHRGPYLIPV